MEKRRLYQMIKVGFLTTSVCMLGIFPVKASEEYRSDGRILDVPESDGETYEYHAMDADGNISIVELPEVVEEEIAKQQEENATSFDVVVQIGINELVVGTYDSKVEADLAAKKRNMMRSVGTAQVRSTPDYSNIKYGVVNFHTKGSQVNTSFTETGTNARGYLNGAYAGDGAFIGYCDANKSQIKFRQAGVEGCVSASDVTVREYDDVSSVNFYRVENGKIVHYITIDMMQPYYVSSVTIGTKQDYMENNVPYYSYDGHYFYTSYEQMITDYKNNTYKNSINPDQPYYNYFQFLTHRTTTNLTAQQLDDYVNKRMGSKASAMKNQGSAFVENQNTYGANALLMFGVAANESAWGTSNYALNRNNLFGHKAYDSNPDNATDYPSVADAIEEHAKYYVSNNYMDPKDVSGLYHGGHLGDKASGMNVKYASDPYWGEKAAAVAWGVEQTYHTDFAKYQIGIVDKMTNLNVRSEASSKSNALYKTGNWGAYPMILLAQTTGENVSGNATWYKIQSDATLRDDRTAITQDTYYFKFDRDYGYVSSTYVSLVVYAGKTVNIPDENENDGNEEEEVNYIPGDANGDGKITPADYVKIKNHIMGASTLSGNALKAADMNNDGSITPADYVKVKNVIMGK